MRCRYIYQSGRTSFELREALLVYRATSQLHHPARCDGGKDAPPTLGPAQPLTVAFIESLVRSLGGSIQAEVLPANILARPTAWLPGGLRPGAARCSTRTPRGRLRN